MTTIIGVQHQWGVEMAADSQITWGDRPMNAFGVNKIINRNGYLIGAAGESRITDFICYEWKPLKPPQSGDMYVFVASRLTPQLRKALTDANIEFKGAEFTILLAVKGQLFIISSDLTVVRDEDGLYGIGTGGDYALGALHAGATVEQAVMIAMRLDINTGGVVQIEKQVK